MIIRLYSSVAIGVVIAHVLFNGPYIIRTIFTRIKYILKIEAKLPINAVLE